MANLKRTPVTYRPFESQAVLADGLLAVARPGGEVEDAIASALFGASRFFQARGEANAKSKGEIAGKAAAAAAVPGLTIEGGTKTATVTPAGIAQVQAPPEIRDTIVAAAAKHGVPPDALLKTAQIESKFDPNAKNPKSSAGGLFGFIDATAAQYGVANRFDVGQSADGAARLMRDNTAYLREHLKRDPTMGELYLAHQQGAAGAFRLLSNPGASAVSLVGPEEVALNGGNANMTAGEFAAMWTQKAGNQQVGEGLGPIAVKTPLDIKATGGKLALTGRDTIYGRAYDAAASRAYFHQLNDEIMTAGQQIGEKYKDDPEQLRLALSDLKRVQLQEHVPDAIRSDFELAFGTMERNYLANAQMNRETKIKGEASAAYDARGDEYANALSRAEAGLDVNNPASFTMFEAHAARLKAHLQDGVAQGLVTPRAAQEAAAKIDGDVAIASIMKHAESVSLEDRKAYRDKLQADYAAGKLPGVDASAWSKLNTELDHSATEQDRVITANTKKLADLSESILTRAASGYDIPAKDIDELRKGAVDVQHGDEIVSATLQVLDIAKSLRDDTIGAAEAKVRDLRELLGKTPSETDVAMVETAEAMIAKARASLATDLQGHAERSGVIPETGNFTDTAIGDMPAMIAQRIEGADTAATHFGVAPRFFKPGEIAGLETMVKADPAQGAAIAAAIVKGAGNRATEVLKEFGQTAPIIAGAGAILADGGDMRAAQDAIAGAGKDATGKPYEKLKGWQGRDADAEAITGAALMFQPEDAARVTATAELIARKRIVEAGVASDSTEAGKIHDRAINEAAGAVYDGDVQYGGFADYDPGFWQNSHKVAVPNSIRADRFGDVIEALRPEDLTVQPEGGIERLQELWPVLTREGYVFVDLDAGGNPLPLGAVNGREFAGAAARPFILKIDGLAAKIGPRLPGAFRGY